MKFTLFTCAHKIHISRDIYQICWGQGGKYKPAHPSKHGCVTTARAQLSSKKLPTVHPIINCLHTLATDPQEETRFNGNIRIHKLKCILLLNKMHKVFCFRGKKKKADGWWICKQHCSRYSCCSKTAGTDGSVFLPLQYKKSNTLLKHCRWNKYLKNLWGFCLEGYLFSTVKYFIFFK